MRDLNSLYITFKTHLPHQRKAGRYQYSMIEATNRMQDLFRSMKAENIEIFLANPNVYITFFWRGENYTLHCDRYNTSTANLCSLTYDVMAIKKKGGHYGTQ